MPRIFDNIEKQLLPALQETMQVADRADFCVGYFNLRGWKQLNSLIERWSGGEGHCWRLLVGMQPLAEEELRQALSLVKPTDEIDNQTALRLKKRLAEEFRRQLAFGAPTDDDEAGLRRLATQIRSKKAFVKFFLRHPLHAKLYLLFRPDLVNPANSVQPPEGVGTPILSSGNYDSRQTVYWFCVKCYAAPATARSRATGTSALST